MVQVVDRAFDILELLATSSSEISLSQVHNRLGLAPSTVHRVLNTLVARGYASQNSTSRLYGPGPKLLEVAARASTNAFFNVQSLVRPVLRELTTTTGETANLAVLKKDRVVYIDQVESAHLVRMFTEVGHQAPLYCTSVGKAMLAMLPAQQREDYLATVDLQSFTPNTLIDHQQLRTELEQAWSRGYAVDNEEREPGVRCVAAAILDHRGVCIAGVSISGPTTRVSFERIDELGRRVRAAARRCSAQLGYSVSAEGTSASTRAHDGTTAETEERQSALVAAS